MDTLTAASLVFGLAAAVGLWLVFLRSRSLGHVLGGWLVLLGILIGARLGFVLLHLEYYTLHNNEIPQFWLGGLSGVGALSGGVLFAFLLSIFLRVQRLALFDEVSGFILPLTLAAWIGDWLSVSLGGLMDPSGRQLIFPLPAGLSSQLERWIPLLAALLFLVVLSLTERWTRAARPGIRSVWLIFLVSLINMGLCVIYPGEWRSLLGMKADTLLWLITSSLFLLFLVFLYLQSRKAPTIEPEFDQTEVIHEA